MKGRGGLIIGQKGQQYGLIKPGSKPAAAKVAAPPRATNVFGDDSDEEDVNTQVAREAARNRSLSKVAEMHAAAEAEDPTVFDYDGVYDSMQQQKVTPKVQAAVERKPRYIAAILEQTERRKHEQDIVYERILKKEQEQDKELYEDKEKFVTAAYRKKLEENKQWQEQEKLREEAEKKRAPEMLGMSAFYQNLTKNVAFGGSKASREQQPAEVAAEPEAAGPSGASAAGAAADGAAASAAAAAASSKSKQAEKLQQLDKYERLRREAELARREQLGRAAAGGEGSAPEAAEAMDVGASAPTAPTVEPAGAQRAAGEAPTAAPESGAPPPAPAAAAAAAQKRHDDAAIAAARERYLARKRKLPET